MEEKEKEERVVLAYLSRTGHLEPDSFPDIVPVTHRKIAVYELLPPTAASSLQSEEPNKPDRSSGQTRVLVSSSQTCELKSVSVLVR